MRRGTRGRGMGGGRPPHRLQNNIPRQLQPPQPQMHSGPLMTDHLQGLKDIDMELDLLKRKREIIEQQQQILSNSYRQRNEYEQNYNPPRESRYDDYTRLYDEPRNEERGGGRGVNSQSRKRPHIPVWESETSPKRFSGPSPREAKSFSSRSGHPAPRQEYQRSEPRFPAPRPYKKPPTPQKRKEFNPTKVTKPSNGPPLKLASYQPPERKKLVTEAANTVRPAQDVPIMADQWVLRADREPSHRMIGRLELGLGAIMKDIRLSNPRHENLFKQPNALRAMKRAVRERIRVAMVGKQITTADNVRVTYYDMYPPENDDHVVMVGLEAKQSKKSFVIDTDDPEKYFKTNMHNLMSKKMDEMIHKLQEIYGSGALLPPLKEKVIKNIQTETKPEDTQTQTAEANGETKPEEAKTDENQVKSDETETAVNESVITDNSTADIQPDVIVIDDTTPEKMEEVPDEKILKLISTDMYLELDKLMTHKMIHLLKKFTPEFVKLMQVNKTFREIKSAIIGETKKKLAKTVKGTDAVTGREKIRAIPITLEESAKNTPEKAPFTPLPYFVKILGKPSLPKRKAMDSFFNEYKPKTIKKHKAIHNLLFVGFNDKEPYDRILAANGTVIGRFTLDIKISERNNKTPNKPDNEGSKLNESSDNVIGSDLDDQIADLLTSIRQSDEGQNFAEDVVVDDKIPAAVENKTDVNMENGDETSKVEPVVEEKQIESNVANDTVQNNDANIAGQEENNDGDDVVEFNDVPQDNDVEEIKEDKNNDVVEIKDDETPTNEDADANVNDDVENKDEVSALKADVKDVKTPTRASARLATPGGLKTRRMSKLTE